MTTNVLDNIVDEIKNLPEDKIPTLLDFLHFLKLDKDSYLSKEEEKIVEEAEIEIESGKGKSWRKIKRDV